MPENDGNESLPKAPVNRLEDLVIDLSKTVKRDDVMKRMTLLTLLSAWAPDPLNTFYRGPSSSGKTYNVTQAAKYFPKNRVWLLGGLSPTALVHDYGTLIDEDGVAFSASEAPNKNDFRYEDEESGRMRINHKALREAQREWAKRLETSHYRVDLSGKVLIFLEAPHEETFNRLRPILSHDAKEISFKFSDRPGGGRLRTMHVKLYGWPAAIFCTTDSRYLEELATRSITFTPEMTGEKYDEAIQLLGYKASEPWMFDFKDPETERLKELISNAIKWREKADNVLIPYAAEFTSCYKAEQPRDMRDIRYILNFISSSAILHHDIRPVLRIVTKQGFRSYIISNYTDLYNAASILIHVWEATQTGIGEHCISLFYNVIIPRWKALGTVPLSMNIIMKDYEERGMGQPKRKTFYSWVKALEDIGWLEPRQDPNDRRKKMVQVVKFEHNNSLLLALDKFKNRFKTDLIKEQILRLINYSSPTKVEIFRNIESNPITIYNGNELQTNLDYIIEEVLGENYFKGLEKLQIRKEPLIKQEISQETIPDNIQDNVPDSNLPPLTGLDRFTLRANERTPTQREAIRIVFNAIAKLKEETGKAVHSRLSVYEELKDYTDWGFERFASSLLLAIQEGVIFEHPERQGFIGAIDDVLE